MFSFKKKEKIEVPLQIPKHIGIIMDGNGRWAKKRMQPRVSDTSLEWKLCKTLPLQLKSWVSKY